MWCRSKRIGMGEGTESHAPSPTLEWHMDNALVMFWRCSGVGVCGGAVGCAELRAGGSIVPDTAGGHRRSVGWDGFVGLPSVRRVCPMR